MFLPLLLLLVVGMSRCYQHHHLECNCGQHHVGQLGCRVILIDHQINLSHQSRSDHETILLPLLLLLLCCSCSGSFSLFKHKTEVDVGLLLLLMLLRLMLWSLLLLLLFLLPLTCLLRAESMRHAEDCLVSLVSSPRSLPLRIVLPPLAFLTVLSPLALLIIPPPLNFAIVLRKTLWFPYYPPGGRCVCALSFRPSISLLSSRYALCFFSRRRSVLLLSSRTPLAFLILSSKAVPIALYLFAHRCLYCPPVPLPIVLPPLNFAIVSSMPVSFYYYPPAGLSVCALSFRVTPKAVRQCPPANCSVCILSPARQVVFVFALPRLLGLLIVSQPARFP